MKRVVIGIVIASIAVYMWGFVVWGMGPYRTMIWKQAADDEAAGQLIREQFPEEGTYYVPAFTHEQQKIDELFRKGPLAMVHVVSATGRPVMDPAIMIKGFVLNVAAIVLIAALLVQVSSALPTYGARVKFVALAGLASAVFIDIGDAVWWELSWAWKSYQAGYHLTAWILTGLVLAFFIGSAPSKDSTGQATKPK